MRIFPLAFVMLLPTLFAAPLRGQIAVSITGKAVKESSGPGAVVTGRAMFADTNGPARFTKILLKSTTSQASDNPFAELMKNDDAGADSKSASAGKKKLTPEEDAEQRKQMAASMKVLSAMADLLQATTVAGDGTFTFTDVKPGTYYIHATAKGYIDPLAQFTQEELESTDAATRKRIAAVAGVVTVSGTEGVHADLRLERGASISGRVLYDDGTPAAGWTVRTVHDLPSDPSSPFTAMGLDPSDLDIAHLQEAGITDDTGYYRISGLATGSYVVQARLTTGALGRTSAISTGGVGGGAALMGLLGLRLTVYSGNAVRRSEAKPVSVRQGQSVAEYDLTLPLRTMHALGGTVRAKADGHAVNTGTVQLSAQTVDGKEDPSFHLSTPVSIDGSFQFDYVPSAATYVLKVANAGDTAGTATRKIFGQTVPDNAATHHYGGVTATAVLGDSDITDLKLDVPEISSAN